MFIGTSDLSFSLGLRGDQKHPAPARGRSPKWWKPASATARRWDVPPQTPEQVKQYIDQGFQLFQAPTDIGFLTAGAKRYLEAL